LGARFCVERASSEPGTVAAVTVPLRETTTGSGA